MKIFFTRLFWFLVMFLFGALSSIPYLLFYVIYQFIPSSFLNKILLNWLDIVNYLVCRSWGLDYVK